MINRPWQTKTSSEKEKKLLEERDKIERLNFIRGGIQTQLELIKLIERRRNFYEENHMVLSEVILWGTYLLTYRGTIQKIDKEFLIMPVGDVMPLSDFQKAVTSLRTKECRIPALDEKCPKCGKIFSWEDIIQGNLELNNEMLSHEKDCD